MTFFLRSILAAALASRLVAGAVSAQTPPPETPAPAAMAAAPADKPKPPPIPHPHWLAPEERQAIAASVPAPPAPGSPEDQADLQTEIEVENSRTPERSLQARKDASYDVFLFLKDVNPALNAQADPKLDLLFQQLHHEEDAVNGLCKSRFGRPRPFVAHADVIHPLGTIGGYSYPSGHSTGAFCHAVILGRIFPDKAALFLDDAKRIAQSRVVMGVHYTTDIEEGERDGREIARELLTKPDFLARLAEVRSEVNPQP